jgi:hypothetical protein
MRIPFAWRLPAVAITTFSAVAIAGTDRPRVIVPRVDRAAQADALDLWRLSFALVKGTDADAPARFRAYFDDWLPKGERDPDGVSIALQGIELLADALDVVGEAENSEPARSLSRSLRDLYEFKVAYSPKEDEPEEATERDVAYTEWVGQVERTMDRVYADIDRLAN